MAYGVEFLDVFDFEIFIYLQILIFIKIWFEFSLIKATFFPILYNCITKGISMQWI